MKEKTNKLCFKDYLKCDGKHMTKEVRKLNKKTPKNKMYGGSSTFNDAYAGMHEDKMMAKKTLLQSLLQEAGYEGPGYYGAGYSGAGYDEEEVDVGFQINIEEETLKNNNFRKVLYTTAKTQLVLMTLKPGEDIGEETHDGDQFFRFEAGTGKMVMGGSEAAVADGDSVVVPEGVSHNVINDSDADLKLYALYAPPQHEDGTIDETKPAAEEECEFSVPVSMMGM